MRIFSAMVLLLSLVSLMPSCKKTDSTTPVTPNKPPTVVNDSIILKNGTVPILTTTVQVAYGGNYLFSWEYKGIKKFEIRKNNVYFDSAKIGSRQLTNIMDTLDFKFLLDNNTAKQQFIIAVGENPHPEISFTYIPTSPIPYGTSTHIDFTTNGQKIIVTSNKDNRNDVIVPAQKNGSYPTGPLTEWTIFTLKVIKGLDTISAIAGVHVDPAPVADSVAMFKFHKWNLTCKQYTEVLGGTYITQPAPTTCATDDFMEIIDGWIQMHQGVLLCFPLEGDIYNSLSWNYVGGFHKVINCNMTVYTITILNGATLQWEYTSLNSTGTGVYYNRDTFTMIP